MPTNCDDYYNISLVQPILLNLIDEITTSIDGWKDDLPNHDNDDSFLPPGLLTLFEKIESTIAEWTIVMNEEFMNEDEIKPIRKRERKRRRGYERLYYWKLMKEYVAMKEYVPPLKHQSDATVPSVSYNLLSDRTPKVTKSKLEVINSGKSFDCDNPSLSTSLSKGSSR
jgi:hypothetical protein